MPKIQLRQDISENWQTQNPVLLSGEIGVETDTYKFKIGNGETAWNNLDYIIPTKLSDLANDSGYINISAIPTLTSQLTNDSGFLTQHQDISGKQDKLTAGTNIIIDANNVISSTSISSGDYLDFNNKPQINGVTLTGNKTSSELGIVTRDDIPTKTSDLTNDSGYINISSVPTLISELINDSGYITLNDIPSIGNGTITINQGGTQKGTFTLNQSGNVTIDLDAAGGGGGGDIPGNMMTTNTVQDISGRKTFLGEKAIYFKQLATTNKLGFTLYNPSGTELAAFEYRPNTISGSALLNVNTSYSNACYVGFRYWGTAVNIVAPKVATAGDYYIPVNVTNGTLTVTANNTGTLDISTLLPDVSNFVTNSDLATTLADYALSADIPTATSDLTNDSGYITGITSSDVTTALGYTPYNSTNPNGYTSNVGTVTSVNNTQPDSNGNVTISIPSTSGLANTNLSNLSATGQKVLDGQWVAVNTTLANDVSLNGSGNLPYTLSLPDSTYKYEVLLDIQIETGSTSGNRLNASISTDVVTDVLVCSARTRTSSTMSASGSIIVPVTTSHKVYLLRNTGYNGTATLRFKGYRRIGTNS